MRNSIKTQLSLSSIHSALRIPHSAFVPSAIFVVALLLRLYFLDGRGLWYDEVASVEVAQRGLGAILTDRFGWMHVQTPFYYSLVWLTILPIDPASTTILVRLPSVLAGALTTLVAFGLGKEMFGRRQGLLAAAMLALSAVHIGYSQDARPYALLTLCTALSVYSLLMAERTRLPRWWAAFVAATITNLYLTYFALTLALPAFLPYLAWIAYRLVRPRLDKVGDFEDTPSPDRISPLYPPGSKQRQYGLLALGIIAVATVPAIVDLSGIPRNPPDLSRLSLDLFTGQISLLLSQLGKVGLEGGAEQAVQWLLALLAVLGVLGVAFASARRRVDALLLCISFVLVPAVLLAVLRTNNTVFQRYALFVMPFYFLLISNGLVSFWEWTSGLRRYSVVAVRAAGLSLATLVLLSFSFSTFIYFDPAQARAFHSQPDYRGVASYLSGAVHNGDLIVLVDEPALAWMVLDFYWKHSPPVATFDVRDPRLCAGFAGDCHPVSPPTVFQVISFLQNDPAFSERYVMATTGAGKQWNNPAYFERALVIQGKEIYPDINTLVQTNPSFQPVLTLQGAIARNEGNAIAAANSFKAAGTYFRSGGEYLATAQGFLDRGDLTRAWREANISLFMQPDNPAVHRWMAARLSEEGLAPESAIESQIADQLENTP